MKNDRDMFFLSSKNQDRLIAIMDDLKYQGYSTDNRVLILVLNTMREEGMILKADNKEILELIRKVVPEGGRILHIKGRDDDKR